jgi:ADP-ribosylglycohydrolase
MKDNYIALFLLHSLGDTLGYNNTLWEFNLIDDVNMIMSKEHILKSTLEIISDFIYKGGISSIDLKGWNISDDTLFNYDIAKFILDVTFDKNNKINETHIIELKKNMKSTIKKQVKMDVERGFGKMSVDAIFSWSDKIDERHKPYNKFSGGNGCAMRTLAIGLRYYKDEDLDKLIECSITSSKITHNSPIGYLSGLCTAFFVKLAVKKVKVYDWVFLLIDLLESKKIKQYINIDDNDIYDDYRNTVRIWKKYVEMFFSNKKEPLNLKTSINLLARIKTMIELNESLGFSKGYGAGAGNNGPTSVIMAYNGLIDCDGNWEKLVYYTMLHGGDSDTVGAIAGGLYGILYGYGNVPMRLLNNLEMKKDLIEIGEKFYEKYQS